MKILINIIIVGLISFYLPTKTAIISEKNTFKTIVQASYSAKRSGELTREQAFNQSLEQKNFYNEKGELIEYWKYEIDGTIYQKVYLEKNQLGKLIKSTSYDKERNLKSYTTTEFDTNGNIVKYNVYNSNNKLTATQDNEYDSNGNVLSISRTNIVSNRTFKTTSKYNAKDQLIEETDFKLDGSIKDVRTFKYDDKGNEITSELTKANGDYTKFISEYDKNNNITSQYWYDKDGNQKHWTSFSYEYDENNNWITKKRYSNGELGFVWERKIEYN
ncbi:hypothetical protein [Aquimarina litoralis]|uniref:hypothetical protein n=1 Tax=Aquimarina litoralis TaxID=584605 RepID=UPI001C57F80F|nr:hypothetical protein [Aquimarina litoralis]MBW1297927.1 hypothetical protein [Aquimarina litoralis]